MGAPRSGVILIEGESVALIKRVNDRGTYYLFPGGGVEPGETTEEAALREAWEELGLKVRLAGLFAIVTFKKREQLYYLAEAVGGEFGTGTGEELASAPDSSAGTYTPVWLPRARLDRYNVRPAELARRIASGSLKRPIEPLRFTEEPRPKRGQEGGHLQARSYLKEGDGEGAPSAGTTP